MSVVSSPPQSDVYIDNVLRGTTDAWGKATISDVTIGEHQVTIRRSRFRDAVFSLSVLPGKANTIDAKLELAVGFLTVSTNTPNSSIDIAGIGRFANAISKMELPSGLYTLTISGPSYVTSRRDIHVTAGQDAKLSVELLADTRRQTQPAVVARNSEPAATVNYIIPSGVVVNGILENEINTKNSKDFDRFRMTVQSPDEFRGASIEGYISGVGRAGKVKGQSSVTFNFQKITLRKGDTYDLAATLQNIIDHDGKTVQVDNEGTAKGNNKAKKTLKRGGIGAVIGAVIGGALGGAGGAAAGAAIGGGAGAGSAAVESEDIKLKRGSRISLQTSSPNRQKRP